MTFLTAIVQQPGKLQKLATRDHLLNLLGKLPRDDAGKNCHDWIEDGLKMLKKEGYLTDAQVTMGRNRLQAAIKNAPDN